MKEKIGDSESKVYEGILADMGRMVINSMLAGDGQSMKGIVRMFDDDLYDAILGTYLRAGVELGSRIVVEKREASKELTDALAEEAEILRELTDLQESTIRHIEDKLASDVAKGRTTKEVTEMIIDSGVFSPMRALRIARTMTGAGASRGQFLSGVLVGADKKTWRTAGDSHVRDAHAKMNGEEVGINELFSNGARYPVDSRLSAAFRINCRCALSFSISDMADYQPDALEQTVPWEPAMSIEDAEEWAKNSKIKETLYHSTDNADDIIKDGFNLDVKIKNGRINGDGVYLADDIEDAKWGNDVLKVKINVKNPMTYSEINDGELLPKSFRGKDRPSNYLPDDTGYQENSTWDWIWELGNEHFPNDIESVRTKKVLTEMGIDAVVDSRTNAGICVFDPKNVVVVE